MNKWLIHKEINIKYEFFQLLKLWLILEGEKFGDNFLTGLRTNKYRDIWRLFLIIHPVFQN